MKSNMTATLFLSELLKNSIKLECNGHKQAINLRRSVILILMCWVTGLSAQFTLQQTIPTQSLSVCAGSVTFVAQVTKVSMGTSTGNTLTIDLGPGARYVPGSIMVTSGTQSVSELNITNINVPVFSVSDIVFTESFVVSYRVELDCSVIGQPVSLNTVRITFAGSGGSKTDTSTDNYNAVNGVVNILPNGVGVNASNNLIVSNAVVGQNFTRTLRIRNGGLGNIESFVVKDTTGNGLAVTLLSGATLLSTTAISGSRTVRVYRVDNFTGTGNNNALFEQNETHEIVLSATVIECTNTNSVYNANFGCFANETCGTTTGTRRLGSVGLNPAVQPNIVTSVRSTRLLCLDDARTGIVVLKNMGTDAATQVSITLYQTNGTTTASNDGRFGFIDTSSIYYQRYLSGVPTVVDPILTGNVNNTVNSDGCGFGKTRQVVLTIPLIPAGDSVVIYANFKGCCNEPCNRLRYVRDGLGVSGSYSNGCRNSSRVISAVSILPRTHLQQEFLVESPTDVNQGDVFNFYIQATRYYFNAPPISFTHRMEVTLPPGLMFSGNLADISILRPNGTPFTVPPGVTYDVATNKIIFTFSNAVPMQERMQILFNNIMADCSKGSGGSIQVNAFVETDPSCSCKPQTYCQSININMHCPSPCLLGGMINKAYDLRRVNLGPSDANNNGIPDSPSTPYSSFVKTSYAVHCDTMESKFTGIVSVTPLSPAGGFTHGFAIDSSAKGAALSVLSARVEITKPGGGNLFVIISLLAIPGYIIGLILA